MSSKSKDSAAARWHAAEMNANDSAWQFHLTDAYRDELHSAIQANAAVPMSEITRKNFPLPMLGPALAALRTDVVEGRGFVLIRGVPVDDLTREEAARVYLGIGSWFGTPVSQNAKGHLLGHVRDLGHDPKDPTTRIYTTTWRQPFHTDSCDIVGLLCLQPSRSGGASSISSSSSVVAALEEKRPDLVRILEQPYVFDRKNEIPEGEGPWYEMPIVHRHAGFTSVIYARDFIDAALERFPDVARLSDIQLEALDAFDALAQSDEFRLDMDFRKGDIQFLHNHQILHSRTTYEDYEDPKLKRHLLRLWLSAHDPRPLPDVYSRRYGPIIPGEIRGGIRVPGVAPSAPLDPE